MTLFIWNQPHLKVDLFCFVFFFNQTQKSWHISYCFFQAMNFLFSWGKSLKTNFQEDCMDIIPSEYYDQKCSNTENLLSFCPFIYLFGKITSKINTAFCVIAVQCPCNIGVGNEAFLDKKVGLQSNFSSNFNYSIYCVIKFLNLSEPFFIQKTEILCPSRSCCINQILPVARVAIKRCNVLASKSLVDRTNFSL